MIGDSSADFGYTFKDSCIGIITYFICSIYSDIGIHDPPNVHDKFASTPLLTWHITFGVPKDSEKK